MHEQFFVDVIRRKPALFTAMLAFNGLAGISPTREAFPAWDVPGLNATLIHTELALLRQRIPSHETGAGFWDFADEPRRLAFLAPKERERLCLVFGVSLHAVEITRIVLRDQVIALKESLGEDLVQYAVQRGQYQLGSVRQFFWTRDVRASLRERILLHGKLALALCGAAWPEELRSRVPDLEGTAESVSPVIGRSIWFALKKILLKEVAPQWTPCFD